MINSVNLNRGNRHEIVNKAKIERGKFQFIALSVPKLKNILQEFKFD